MSSRTRCVFHMQHATFDIILNILWDQLILQPTNLKPYPTSPDRQLALSLYRLAHGVSYSVLEDVCIDNTTFILRTRDRRDGRCGVCGEGEGC